LDFPFSFAYEEVSTGSFCDILFDAIQLCGRQLRSGYNALWDGLRRSFQDIASGEFHRRRYAKLNASPTFSVCNYPLFENKHAFLDPRGGRFSRAPPFVERNKTGHEIARYQPCSRIWRPAPQFWPGDPSWHGDKTARFAL